MSLTTGWTKLPRGRACPVCGSGSDPRRPNTLCLTSGDGCVAGCGKSGGAAWAGKVPFRRGRRLWFYRLRDRDPSAPHVPRPQPRERRRLNFDRLFAGWWREAHARGDWLADLAAELGVTVASLERLGIGWAPAARAEPDADPLIVGTRTLCRLPGTWVFPMRDRAGGVVGARVRTGRGSKYAVDTTDGDGVLAPSGLLSGRTLLLPEGPTSVAALLTLGFDAIGRPANYGGVATILGYAARLRPARVLLVADNDERFNAHLGAMQWPGREGAEAVAAGLARAGLAAGMVYPPAGVKDARAWLNGGATTADVRGFWGRTAGKVVA